MNSWIVTATVPATVFDAYDVTEVLDSLAEFTPSLDGGTVDTVTGRQRPWRVAVDVPAPTARGAAAAGVRVIELAFGRRALGFDVVTHVENEARVARALDGLSAAVPAAVPWPGPCVP